MENNKNLSRVPRALAEYFNFDLLSRSFSENGSIMVDLVLFLSNYQMKDLFGEIRFSVDEFCKTMGYDRTKLQRKLTEEQLSAIFGNQKPIYYFPLSENDNPIEHKIETVFEVALYKLGIENLRFPIQNKNGSTSYHFVQIIERFDINYDYRTNKKTKRVYSVSLSNKILDSLFTTYNLIELNDYKKLPDRTGFRYFYLQLSRMMVVVKWKIKKGEAPFFLISVDQLAKIFDIEEPINKEKEKLQMFLRQ